MSQLRSLQTEQKLTEATVDLARDPAGSAAVLLLAFKPPDPDCAYCVKLALTKTLCVVCPKSKQFFKPLDILITFFISFLILFEEQ